MNFLKRIVSSVAEKQGETMRQFENNTLNVFMPQEPGEYFRSFPELFFRSITKRMQPHGQAISSYLSKNGFEEINIDRVVSSIEARQNGYLQVLEEQTNKRLDSKLDIGTSLTVERPTRIEKETAFIVQTQTQKPRFQQPQNYPEIKIEPQTNEPLVSQKHQPSNVNPKPSGDRHHQLKNVHISSLIANNSMKSQVSPDEKIDRSISLHLNKANPEHQAMTASQFIGKRDIVKELEEKRKKLQEQELKSKKLKMKLVKLEPIASKKQKSLKEQEAKDKLLAGIDFVKGLHSRKHTLNSKPTEWKQERLKTTELKQRNSPKCSFRKLSPLRGAQIKNFQENGVSRMMEESNIKKTDRIISRIQRDKNYVLRKPMPYNLYNVNFIKDEVFQLHYK